MSLFRNRLSAWSIAWLLSQVVSVSALLPPGCCAAHAAAARSTEDCHEVPATAECPMHDAAGAQCPMHQGTGSGQSDSDCVMRQSCNGPAVALGHLFSVPGILLDQSETTVRVSVPLILAIGDSVHDTPASLETPPPRS